MPIVSAQPYDYVFDLPRTALIVIDMQRDFIEPDGFGAALGNDVGHLRTSIAPAARVLAAAREAGLTIVHTREGHRGDLADLHPAKHRRGRFALRIGDPGPMGRILIQGEPGHAIIPELAPLAGEIVIDKPGKGAFYATELDNRLRERNIEHLILCGVTTEICVSMTLREANDRGFDCLVLEDATASYFPEFHHQTLRMITAQDGLLGWVGGSAAVVDALTAVPAQ
jgi:nicotinamidase-related amidase